MDKLRGDALPLETNRAVLGEIRKPPAGMMFCVGYGTVLNSCDLE